MSNDAPSRPPRTLDREAVERVLQRATSLQARADGPRAPLLDETAVYEAGAELGLAPELVRRALLEERASGAPVTETQLATRFAGPGTVTVSRLVSGDGRTTLAALEEWMHRQECLGPRRRRPDEIVWEARHDWTSHLLRSMRLTGRRYRLAQAREVRATVADDGHGQVCVRLTADLRNRRLAKLASGGALAGLGVVAAGAGAVAGAPVPLDVVMAAAGAGAGAAVSRTHAAYAAAVVDSLERVLDHVESGEEVRPSALGAAVSRGLSVGLEQLRRAATHGRMPPPPTRPGRR